MKEAGTLQVGSTLKPNTFETLTSFPVAYFDFLLFFSVKKGLKGNFVPKSL